MRAKTAWSHVVYGLERELEKAEKEGLYPNHVRIALDYVNNARESVGGIELPTLDLEIDAAGGDIWLGLIEALKHNAKRAERSSSLKWAATMLTAARKSRGRTFGDTPLHKATDGESLEDRVADMAKRAIRRGG